MILNNMKLKLNNIGIIKEAEIKIDTKIQTERTQNVPK